MEGTHADDVERCCEYSSMFKVGGGSVEWNGKE